MSHECHEGSCSSHSHHSHHHHGEGCNCPSCCCEHENECCDHQHHQKYSHELLELADEAWMEVLKEKIKDQIRTTSTQHLDKLAKLISETNHLRWKHKMEEKTNCEGFEDHLREIMHQKE